MSCIGRIFRKNGTSYDLSHPYEGPNDGTYKREWATGQHSSTSQENAADLTPQPEVCTSTLSDIHLSAPEQQNGFVDLTYTEINKKTYEEVKVVEDIVIHEKENVTTAVSGFANEKGSPTAERNTAKDNAEMKYENVYAEIRESNIYSEVKEKDNLNYGDDGVNTDGLERADAHRKKEAEYANVVQVRLENESNVKHGESKYNYSEESCEGKNEDTGGQRENESEYNDVVYRDREKEEHGEVEIEYTDVSGKRDSEYTDVVHVEQVSKYTDIKVVHGERENEYANVVVTHEEREDEYTDVKVVHEAREDEYTDVLNARERENEYHTEESVLTTMDVDGGSNVHLYVQNSTEAADEVADKGLVSLVNHGQLAAEHDQKSGNSQSSCDGSESSRSGGYTLQSP